MAKGHIRKRTSKTGAVSYQLVIETERDPVTGKRERSYFTYPTKKQAEAELQHKIYALNTGGVQTAPSSMKLKDWLTEWMNVYKKDLEATSRASYLERIDYRITPYLGNVPLKNITPSAVQQWLNTLQTTEGLAPKSIANLFNIFNPAMERAVVNNMIPSNPCAHAVLPKKQPYRAQVYNRQQIQQLFALVKDTDMELIVLLGLYLGLRRGEMVALQWSDVDLTNGIVHIHRNCVLAKGKTVTKAPKSAAGVRSIPLGAPQIQQLKAAYKQYLEDKLAWGKGFKDNDLVIRKPDGSPYNPDSISQKWERFVKNSGLPVIRLHDLRHSCATALVAAGVNPKTVQTLMGHANMQVTMGIYVHSTPQMNQAAATALNQFINPTTPAVVPAPILPPQPVVLRKTP